MNYLKTILKKSGWTSMSSAFFLVLQTIAFLIIPRYVTTVDLGCFAIASSFVFIGMTIIEYAFSSSLIYNSEIADADYRAVFRLNLKSSFLIILLGIIICGYLAWREHNYSFLYLLIGLSPILLLNSNISTQYAGLKRALKFRIISITEIIGNLLYFFCLITLLYFEFGIWALIVAYVVKYTAIMLWLIINDWTYTNFSIRSEKALLAKHYNYGKYIIGEKGLSSALSYADTFIVGHFFGLHTLGIYDILKKIILRPLVAMYNAVEGVIFPLLTKQKNKPFHFNSIFKDFTTITKLVFIPILFLVFLFGKHLIYFFPENYQAHGDLITAIAFFGIAVIIANPIDILLYSKGKTRTFFYWQLGISVPFLIVLMLSAQQGLYTMIIAMGLFYTIVYLLSYFLINKVGVDMKISLYYSPVLFTILLFFLWIITQKYFDGVLQDILMGILIVLVVAIEGIRYQKSRTEKSIKAK